MRDRCTSIRQEDLADALKAAVDIEQQRVQNLSDSDAEKVAGGTVINPPVIIIGGGGTTAGMYPTGGDGSVPTIGGSSSN
jgi:hypothetical protein